MNVKKKDGETNTTLVKWPIDWEKVWGFYNNFLIYHCDNPDDWSLNSNIAKKIQQLVEKALTGEE